MADITDLLDHVGEVRAPALERLTAVAERRRRRGAVAVTGGVAVAVVTILLALPPLGARDAAPTPIAPDPTPSEPRRPDPTASTPPPDSVQGPFPTLTPEEVRNHPDAVVESGNDIPVTAAPGVGARLWSVCLADCSRDTQQQFGELQWAVELTRDGFRTSALHPYTGAGNLSHAVGDWFVLGNALVDGRGERRLLRTGEPLPVTAIDGPLVYASTGVAWVDLDARELHPIAGDGLYWDWWGAADTWFWGNVYATNEAGDVVRQGLTWRDADGSHGVHVLPFGVTEWSTQMLRSGQPGTMGAIEPGPTRLLHVSTDYGATWDVRVLPERWGTGTSVPGDWRSWTEQWPSWDRP